MNTILWIAAIVATTYAWIRFCDWVVAPWLERRNSRTVVTVPTAWSDEAYLSVLRKCRIELDSADILTAGRFTAAERTRMKDNIDEKIVEVMRRLSTAGGRA